MLKEKHALVVLALIALSLTLWLGLSSHVPDFMVYYYGGRSLLNGRVDLYAPDFALSQWMDYRYPPLFLLVIVPLSLLPYRIALILWYALEIGALIGCVMVLRRVTESARRKLAMWVIAFLIVEQYLVATLNTGNVQLIVAFSMFVGLWLATRRKDLMAALLIALAVTIKPLPLMLMPYFLIRKQWRFVLMTVVFVVVLNAAPAAYFGFHQNTELLQTWLNKVARDPNDFHELTGPVNVSLRGQLRRYLTAVDYSQRPDGYPAVNFLSLSPRMADVIWGTLSAALLVSTLGLLWWRNRHHSESTGNQDALRSRIFLELGPLICLMLIISPSTTKVYCIALLWPAVTLADFALNYRGAAAGVSRCVLLMAAALNLILPLLPGRPLHRFLDAIGADFYVLCLLMIGLSCAVASSGNRSAPERGSTRTVSDGA
jgi:hypothetical protein